MVKTLDSMLEILGLILIGSIVKKNPYIKSKNLCQLWTKNEIENLWGQKHFIFNFTTKIKIGYNFLDV
jgi:hypothetical protein